MNRLLALTPLLLVTVFAVSAQAAAECESEANADECFDASYQCDVEADPDCASQLPSAGGCDADVCAYGSEDCIECSGPIDPTRGPDDGSCENCRDLEVQADGGSEDAASAKVNVPGFGALLGLAAMAGALMVARRS